MDPVTPVSAAQSAYATASHATVFASVALSFVGLGWALVLMLRPRTSAFCIWSMVLFSLAWLIDSTTHLLGVGGHAPTHALRYGVWVAVGLFGLGLVVGVLGVLAYLRNEHKYDRGLTIGVFATLLNLWVVGGIVVALRANRMAELGRGLVIPVMPSGGPVDIQALVESQARGSGNKGSERSQKMRAMLGRAFADLTSTLGGEQGMAWELQSDRGDRGPAAALAGHECGSPEALQALHPGAQYLLTLSGNPGWMSLELADSPHDPDAAGALDAAAEKVLAAQVLSLTPARRQRATRTHLAGFEVVRTSVQASVNGIAGPVFLDRWVAVAGSSALQVVACAPEDTSTFQAATTEMVAGLLRKLQRDGAAGPVPPETRQRQYIEASRLEQREQFGEALGHWEQAASIAPVEPEAFLGVLRCSWKLGRPKQALTWLESGTTRQPGTVSTAVAGLRIRAANGQAQARKELLERFQQGLADDDALAALLVSFAARQERAGALEVLASFGDRHGASLVAWWHGYLTTPPATAGAATTAAKATATPPPPARVATRKPAGRPMRSTRPTRAR
jgi:hypothetical protein